MAKILLRERAYPIQLSKENVKFFDKPQLIESVDGRQFEALAVIHNLPVATYLKNLNDRIYNQPLWKRVHERNMFEGIPAFDSHLDNPRPTEILGIWHNYNLNNQYPYADLYIISEVIYRALKAGLKTLGVSTSGFGELGDDGMTVIPESYEIHSCDLVFQPSQGTMVPHEQLEDLVNKPSDSGQMNEQPSRIESTETVQTTVQNPTQESTNKVEAILNEAKNNKVLEDVAMSEKLIEANLKLDLDDLVRDSRKALKKGSVEEMRSMKEKMQSRLSILPIESQFEQINEMKALMNKIDESIEVKLEEATKTLNEAQQTSSNLGTEVAGLKKVVEAQKAKLVQADEIIDQLQKGSYKNVQMAEHDQKLFVRERTSLITDLEKALEESVEHIKQIREMKTKLQATEIANRKMKKERNAMLYDFKLFKEDREHLKRDIAIASKKIKEMDGDGDFDADDVYPDMPSADDFDLTSNDMQSVSINPAQADRLDQDDDYAAGMDAGFMESKQPVSSRREIREYFEMTSKEFPYIRKYKENILNAKHLADAIRFVEKVEKSIKDKPVSLSESMESSSLSQGVIGSWKGMW